MSHFRFSALALVVVVSMSSFACALDTTEEHSTQSDQGLSKAKDKDDCGFVLSSPSFKSGAPLPAPFTCEGKPFADGLSPELDWRGEPQGTKSFALVLKDLSIEAGQAGDTDPNHAYHWTIWNIKGSAKSLPASLPIGQFPLQGALKSAEQLNGAPPWLEPHKYFGPCPNLVALLGAPLETHNDEFILYAFKESNLVIPEDPGPDPAAPYSRVRQLAVYFEAHNIGKAELKLTSNATPSCAPGFGPPFPACP
jgi:phosphatidylethanolamine-binding protein (PEBP) family uncharacterized protein